MNSYKLRIDGIHLNDKLLKGILKYSFVDEKKDTNPHTHYYLETTLQRASLVARVKNLPTYKPGNGFYSLRHLKPDEDGFLKYHAYMVKEGKVVYSGFPDDEIAEIIIYNDKIVADMKKKKKAKKTIINQIIEEYTYDETPPLDAHQVITDVIAFYKKHEKLVREFAMVSQVQTLLLRYLEDYGHTLAGNIFKAIDKTQ